MSEEIQRVIGELGARVHALERRIAENEGWIKRGILALLGGGAGVCYAYLKSMGFF